MGFSRVLYQMHSVWHQVLPSLLLCMRVSWIFSVGRNEACISLSFLSIKFCKTLYKALLPLPNDDGCFEAFLLSSTSMYHTTGSSLIYLSKTLTEAVNLLRCHPQSRYRRVQTKHLQLLDFELKQPHSLP